jgi:predicted ArsR family transcriptional regulator
MLLLCAIGDIRAVSRGRDPRGRPARAYPAGRTGRSRRADEDPGWIKAVWSGVGARRRMAHANNDRREQRRRCELRENGCA